MEKTRSRISRYFICIFLGGSFIFFSMLYLQPNIRFIPSTITIHDAEVASKDYLIFTPKCMIPDVDPWNEEVKPFYKKESYVPCNKFKLLTYIVKNSSSAILHVNDEVKKFYSSKPIKCCYINVTRNENATVPDNHITFSKCTDFNSRLDITGRTVTVKCRSKNIVYSNSYSPITITKNLQTKMQIYANLTKKESKPLNVLFIGIDSISRLNFIRTMQKSRQFLVNTGWVEYKGYNKIADNTFPNLVAMLTGKHFLAGFKTCNPYIKLGCLDKANFIWSDYQKLGYITAYAEDESSINTFNYNKKGFLHEPVDYYLRAYSVAINKLQKKVVDEMEYCTGPESSGERILKVATDFIDTFIDYPTFGFFWMNSFSHNILNAPTRMDDKVFKVLESIYKSKYSNNSVIIFLSDHGIRFGNIRATRTGWLEERLPFLYFWFPKWFRHKYPEQYYNLITNAKSRLTTPYDVYMTVQDILVLSGLKYKIKPSEGCPACKSLFTPIPFRSCEDVSIETHWCTCYGYKSINTTEKLVEKASKFIVHQLNGLLGWYGKAAEKCAKYGVSKVLRAGISAESSRSKEVYLLVVVETVPEAIFESTLVVEAGEVTRGSYLSRLDRHVYHSNCVQDGDLKKYCFCK